MQENFTRKLKMTNRKVSPMTNPVKILKDAEIRAGSIPEIHRRLIKMGVEISVTALYDAAQGRSKSLKPANHPSIPNHGRCS